MMHTNIRLNRDERATQIEALPSNLLPTIVQSRASLSKRVKSQSSKRIVANLNQDIKLIHQKSTRKLSKEQKEEEGSNKKADLLESLLVKKQGVLENSGGKPSTIRSKLFSLKTPSRSQARIP